MLDTETLRVLLSKFEQGLVQCKEREAAAMEQRLRQEGAVLAMRQLLQEQEQAAQVIAVPLVDGGDDGSNT